MEKDPRTLTALRKLVRERGPSVKIASIRIVRDWATNHPNRKGAEKLDSLADCYTFVAEALES